jgi:hypothetical protein
VSDFDFDLDDITVMITSIWFWVLVLIGTLSAILYYYTSTSSVGIYFCFLYLPLIYLALPHHTPSYSVYPPSSTITTFIIYIVFPHYFVHGATSMLYHVGRGIQFISQYIYTLYAFLYCSLYYYYTTRQLSSNPTASQLFLATF